MPERVKPEPPSKDDKALIGEMLERQKLAAEAENSFRKLALADLRFAAAFDEDGRSTQWNDTVLRQWEEDGRPALTLDQTSQFVNHLQNEFRQMMPAGQVNPVDSGADIQTAEALRGIIRAIEQNSHARVAYETAFDFMVRCGFGAWRYVVKYTYDNPTTAQEFNAQHIEVKRIKNPFGVYADIAGEEPDGSDWEWCVLAEDLIDSVYRRKYRGSFLASLSDWRDMADVPMEWLNGQSVRVAEYFYAKYRKEAIVLLSDDTIVPKKVLLDNIKQYGNAGLAPGVEVLQERTVSQRSIRQIKCNAVEVLESTDWMGAYIPVIPMYGSELTVGGKLIRYGVVRNMKDAQRGLNYMSSSEVEAIGLMPKAPYMAAEGQIAGYEAIYALANKKTYAVLPYKPVSIDGHLVGPPQRQSFEPAIQSISFAKNQFQNDLKAAPGMYGSSLGEPSGEKSGLAIGRRQAQGARATFHYQSNAERAIWHGTRILIDLIPHIYDSGTVTQILGKDNKRQQVTLDDSIPVGNQPEEMAARAEAAKEGRFNIHAGRYDVTISVAPSYASQRQEAVAQWSEILKTWPNLFPIAGDILIRNMDIPGSDEIADKIKEAMNPQGKQIPPEIQQRMQQMTHQLQMMAQQLQEARQREMANLAKIESTENIAALKNEVEMEKIKLQAAIKEAELRSKEFLEEWKIEASHVQAMLAALREPNVPESQPPVQ